MFSADAMTAATVWLNVLYLLCRYAHLVSAMLLVGGILFYEMIVPKAIAELPEPTQLAIFARARWAFRWVIWLGIAALILSGIYMTFWRMRFYIEGEFVPTSLTTFFHEQIPWPLRTGWWWAGHVLFGGFAMLIALSVVSGDRPPANPVNWLRLDLMVLLIVIFFAAVTRQVDQIHQDRALRAALFPPSIRYISPEPTPEAPSATQPTTQPAAP